jgi:hypothetical protein
MPPNTSSKLTTDHDAIRLWAEERGAKPVLIAKNDGEPGNVRLEFSGSRNTSLRKISWEGWFQHFDKSKLALLYQQETPDGERSSYCKIVRCEIADKVERAVGGRGRSAVRRGPARAGKPPRLRPALEANTSSQPRIALRSPKARKTAEKKALPKSATKPARQEKIGS